MACEGHLYGSGETLVWLGSDASNTREDCLLRWLTTDVIYLKWVVTSAKWHFAGERWIRGLRRMRRTYTEKE